MDVPSGWETREVGLRITAGDLRTLWLRLRQWDLDHGGRFSVADGRTVMLWSGSRGVNARIEPVGAFTLDCDGHIRVARMYWRSGFSTPEEVWRGIALLLGIRAKSRPPNLP